MTDPTCFFCGEPSVAWCDGILLGESGKPLGIETGRLQWCNRPICRTHCRTVGHFRASPRGDSIDHCPDCLAVDGRRRATEAERPVVQGALF